MVKQRELFTDIQKKYNLKLNANNDFRESSDTGWESQISGRYFKIIPISYLKYKFFYAPTTVLDLYFLVDDNYLVPAYQNIYIPLGRMNQIILVRPDGVTSGDLYFQYWLSNIESVKVFDVYEKIGFTLPMGGGGEAIFMPFPTYQMKFYLKIPTNPTSIDFNINIQPVQDNHTFALDELDGTTEKLINNYYEYNKIGGSGVVTNPHYPFPSWSTYIGIINNDVGADIVNCRLKVISWED